MRTMTNRMTAEKTGLLVIVVILACLLGTTAWAERIHPDIRPGSGVTYQGKISDYFPALKQSNLDTPLFILDSGKPGATALAIGGTHGNELAGQVAALIMIENLQMKEGRLIIIPYANRSALSVKDTRKQIDRQHLIKSRSGMRFLPYGDRRTDPDDQVVEDAETYTTPSGYLLTNGKEARNLNRTYPGNPNGTPTEQLAHAILTMIIDEKVDFTVDFHEARTPEKTLEADKEYGGANKQLAYTVVAHPRGTEMAAYALLGMEEETGFSMKLEESNPEYRGLSHLEIGNATQSYAFLSESPNPGQDKWRTDPDVVRDPKYSLGHRVGVHLRAFQNIADAFTDMTDKPFSADGMPGYRELMDEKIGSFLN